MVAAVNALPGAVTSWSATGVGRTTLPVALAAFMLEQHLPPLWGRLADSLQNHYGVKAAALEHLRFEAGRAAKVVKWVEHLVAKYVAAADAYTVFEARRAAREALWAWTALTETV